jgi:hypothetical protein
MYASIRLVHLAMLCIQDIDNARTTTTNKSCPRVPPLKIRIPPVDKLVSRTSVLPPLEARFHCAIKLDRIDLSHYDIGPLPTNTTLENDVRSVSHEATMKNTASIVTRSYEHQKSLKRLTTVDTSQPLPSSTVISKGKISGIRSSASNTSVSSLNTSHKQTRPSNSTDRKRHLRNSSRRQTTMMLSNGNGEQQDKRKANIRRSLLIHCANSRKRSRQSIENQTARFTVGISM